MQTQLTTKDRVTIIDLLMVQMWVDQFRKIPPENLADFPVEAKIAWALIRKSLRR